MDPIRYDFTKPGRLGPEVQHGLTSWLRAAFVLAGKTWAKELPVPLEASLGQLDVSYAKEALARLEEGMIGYRVTIGDALQSFLIVPRTMLLRLIGSLLGERETDVPDRELTVIDENLADFFLVKFWLPFFRATWPRSDVPAWTLHERHANPQASRLFPPAESLVTLTWTLKGPWGESSAHWYFQRKGLCEAIGDRELAAAPAIPPDVLQARRETSVRRLPLFLEVVLGTADLPLSQLARLQAGDVILLDQRADAAIVARTGGRDLFRGKAGRLGSWKAFQVESLDKR